MIFWIIYYSLVHISLFGTVLRGILTRFLMSSSICGNVQTPKNPCSNMFYAVHLWTESKFLNSKSKGSVYLRKSRIKVKHMSYFEQSFKYFYISWFFFCVVVDRQKAFILMSSRDHCQRSSPSLIFDTLRAGFEPAQNLSSVKVEWSYEVLQ